MRPLKARSRIPRGRDLLPRERAPTGVYTPRYGRHVVAKFVRSSDQTQNTSNQVYIYQLSQLWLRKRKQVYIYQLPQLILLENRVGPQKRGPEVEL